MSRLPQVTGKQLARAARRDGYAFTGQTGSHAHYQHPDTKVLLVIPLSSKPLKRGTLTHLVKQAGWSRDRFRELLR